MKIGMILDHEFPPDIRVEKEARTLIKAGHEIYLLCVNKNGENSIDSEFYEGIKLCRTDFYPRTPLVRKFNSWIYRFTFKNYKLISQIRKFVAEHSIDVLHVHDLPMVKSALIVGKAKGILVVADLHENFPAFYNLMLNGANMKARLLNGIERWKKYEKQCISLADKVIVVVDEAKERIRRDNGVSQDKIAIIGNTEDVNVFNNIKIDRTLVDQYKNYFVLSYVGGFGPHRGLDVPIKAISTLKDHIHNIKLLLVGDGGNRADLEQLAKKLNVAQYVEFTGWKPFHLVPTYISLSDICLVPHHSNGHTEATVPHKLFQYMLMAKPVVVSTCKPLARIVNETKAGLVFESGNIDDFSRVCLELKNPEKRKNLGENGKQAVLEKYNWEKTGIDLAAIYEDIDITR